MGVQGEQREEADRGLSRRDFLRLSASAALSGLFFSACGRGGGGVGSTSGPIKVASLLDTTGGLEIVGGPMTDATTFAIDTINKNGGVLGRKLELVAFDTLFKNEKYTEFGNKLVLDKDVAVVMGGITSASREAVRPIFHNAKRLYFYNEQYEGGVCDKYTFNTGVVPTQQLEPLIQYAIEKFGNKFYTIAADYNYGQISVQWINKILQGKGGTQLGVEFIPLDVAEHGATIEKIKKTQPQVLMSLTVGPNQQAFYRQWRAAGLKDAIPIVSPTFGIGQDHIVLDPSEAKGVVVCYPYFEELDNEENKKFVKAWREKFGDKHKYIIDSVNVVVVGWNLWAKAVEKAKTTETDAVIKALESGLEFDAPSGKVVMDPGSHHVSHSVYIGVTTDKRSFEIVKSFPPIPPKFEQSVCDLVKNPDISKQFTP